MTAADELVQLMRDAARFGMMTEPLETPGDLASAATDTERERIRTLMAMMTAVWDQD